MIKKRVPDVTIELMLKDKKSHNNPLIMGDIFLKQHINIVKNDSRNLFNYNKDTGLYEELILGSTFNDVWQKYAKKYGLGMLCKSNAIKDIYNSIASEEQIKKVAFNDYDNLICFENCILNIDTLEEIQFSDKFYFNTKTSIPYDKEAVNSPVFDEFLNTTFLLSDGATIDEETKDIVLQIGGYLLYPKSTAEKMFIFLGNGSNGKSILIEIFQMLFPKDCLSHFSLASLAEDSKELDKLIHSRFNSATETKGERLNTERLKQFISGEPVMLKRKHKDAISIIPQAKIVVASNSHPAFNDASNGIERRCYYLNFETRFCDEDEYNKIEDKEFLKVKKKKQKLPFIKDIKSEMPAIVNKFLGGMQKLRSVNWEFKETQNSLTAKAEQKENTNQLAVFLSENYKIDKEGILSNPDILKDFKAEYFENNYTETKMGARGIGTAIATIFGLKGERKTINGKKLRYYPLVRTTTPSKQAQSIKHGNTIKQLSFTKDVK